MSKQESGDFKDPSPRWANAENAGGAISIVPPAAVRLKKGISLPIWITARVVVCVPGFVRLEPL
jgi:hypothetical protein